MKQTAFFLFFFLGVIQFTSAQTTSGTVVLGADFPNFFRGFSRAGMKVNAGVFIADNFLLGANSGVRSRSLRNLAGQRINGAAIDLSAFVRYYIPNPKSDFRIFIHGEGGLDYAWADDLEERYEFAALGAGVAFFIKHNIALEASTRVIVNNRDDEFNLSLPGWGLGVKYFIGS